VFYKQPFICYLVVSIYIHHLQLNGNLCEYIQHILATVNLVVAAALSWHAACHSQVIKWQLRRKSMPILLKWINVDPLNNQYILKAYLILGLSLMRVQQNLYNILFTFQLSLQVTR
jgi:hypothetical protein